MSEDELIKVLSRAPFNEALDAWKRSQGVRDAITALGNVGWSYIDFHKEYQLYKKSIDDFRRRDL